ncbi:MULTISPECIES: hypothetical protein [unclassified Variovorax]|uniref:hypothetical protein n=1 Tax=unclassified Variovorax TaxID=663243 RepID=UPI0012ED54E8|nr:MULTISPECIES: hypothetical protein [unclassified Variovorax]
MTHAWDRGLEDQVAYTKHSEQADEEDDSDDPKNDFHAESPLGNTVSDHAGLGVGPG